MLRLHYGCAKQVTVKALTAPLTRSICEMKASSTSVGETSFTAIRRLNSVALCRIKFMHQSIFNGRPIIPEHDCSHNLEQPDFYDSITIIL